MNAVSTVKRTGKRVFSDFSEKNVTLMAGGIAYNAFVSLAPALILLLFVISALGGGLETRVIEIAGQWLPTPIANVVKQIFQGDSSAAGASVVGVIVLVWGTLKIFRSLDTAFSEIYETEDENSFVDQVKDGVVVLVALVVAVLATVGVTVAFSAFSDTIPLIGLLTPLVLVVGLAVAFLPMYYRFPDADLGVKDVVPGVLFAAVGWAVLQGLFQVYLAFKDPTSGGFFGGIIVVVTYLYFSGLVLLLGAVVNAVLGGHSSGAPGGVGRGAANTDSRSLGGDELAVYLSELRERLTGRYEGMRPTTDGADDPPRPADEVEVVERTTSGDGGTERTVTLRWTTPDAESTDET